LFNQIFNLKKHFGESSWSFDGDEPIINSKHKSHCNGEDLWLPFEDPEKNSDMGEDLVYLCKFFFQEGLIDFLKNSKHGEFKNFHEFEYNFVYHIINYGNNGYYNWHKDSRVSGQSFYGVEVDKKTTYTFALTLIKDESLLKGGKQLFMKDGNIVEIESKNNQLVIFPSNVYHSLTEIQADENLSWENRRFNIQAWLCHL
jgi:hypothetical protein